MKSRISKHVCMYMECISFHNTFVNKILSNLLDQMTTFAVNHTANQLQIGFVSIGIPNKLVRVQLLL